MADNGTLHSLTTKRSKKGCQTCRIRKKKCDEVHPECGGCVRNSLLCQWPVDTSHYQRPRRRRRHQNARLWPSGIDIPQGLDAMVVVFAVPSRQVLHRLLFHFTQFSPQWMSISPGRRRNQFLRHVMPLALENPLTLNCILAASAADLMKYDIEQPGLKTIALELYGKSIAGLSAAVSRELAHGPSIKAHGPASEDDILLAVLLLCVHETHNFSDTNRLLPHLNAAAVLLQQRLHFVPPNTELRTFLLEIFCYFFALTTFSHGPCLAITPAAQIFESLRLKRYDTQSQSLLLGPSQDIIVTIFWVSTLTMHSVPCMLMDDGRRSQLTSLESQLQSWYKSVPIEDTVMDKSYDEDMVMFELYRLACLAYVKNTHDPQVSPRNPSLQQIVASFVNELGFLPDNSPVNGLLVWPLVVIGLCAVVSTHQRIIIGRLRVVHKTWRSDIFIHSIQFLRDRWKTYRELGEISSSKTNNSHHTTTHETLPSSFSFQDLHFPTALV